MMNSRDLRLRAAVRRRGFTLIEILVVVVIIGILGAMIVPSVVGRGDQSRVTAARNDLRAVANALDMYHLDNSHYPTTDQGLQALVTKPAGFPEPKNYNAQGYLKKAPADPWGTPLVYLSTGDSFELYSLGADGAEGGEGLAADLNYADL